jgi:hypothetical protein
LPTWRIWARGAAIEKKDLLKARGYSWSPGELGRPRCWHRDVADADKAAEAAWLRENVVGPDQAVWELRIRPEIDSRIDVGLGVNLWNRMGGYCRTLWHALEECNRVRHSFGGAERLARVAAPQRFPFEHIPDHPPLGHIPRNSRLIRSGSAHHPCAGPPMLSAARTPRS